jgi:hypothetical protein
MRQIRWAHLQLLSFCFLVPNETGVLGKGAIRSRGLLQYSRFSLFPGHDEGRDRWNLLLHRRAEPAFYAFDLLWLNGKDLRQLPLIDRKKRLRQLIGKSDCERIIYVQHIEMCGCVLYRAICKKDLEGIICKKKNDIYSVSGQWLKVLNPKYTRHMPS